ncbi:hypothetical protein PHYSODRAFT_537581 [Phytophthora sojae]|uniref:Temptin Cys/Cys disulfide domain-containing protein n=1 Tax=Phytophthora sojae (strain P6497) TaxID=1094619 RepID=G4YJ43_PHYSP|nr:hypothetical protein PHYSODRAFT_537581 [Phytophthora sojae]EGZ29183.1 hypothetical protein PHYSODRAFT_537581 [Phytophthora sojae]|eukprot:XP_009516458.1 hypothetical protein PHYSODRAFT_537581 [Phytophthora sojae]
MFQKKIPNGGNVPGVQALGHEKESGGPNNDFGMDFVAAMFQWTKDFCEKDSDGDGQTNGQELGDPCCEFEFRKNEQLRWTQGVSHPGDPELKADPALWADVVCGAAAEPEATEEKATEAEAEAAEETKPEATEAAEPETLTAGAPALQSSVMLSAVALTAVVVYFAVVRTGRRSTRNLPIFRQRRGAPM